MSKRLFNKEKSKNVIEGASKEASKATSAADLNQASIGAYAPLSAEMWEEADESNLPLSASPQGRLAIRLFSRGVVGSAFFAGGSLLAGKWLRDYDAEASILEQHNPLTFISKIIDTVAGKPIEVGVRNFGKITGHEAPERLGRRAVTFRKTALHTSARAQGGRSLGHEMSSMTFDFFSGSVGDALGRDISGWVDPNVKKDWVKDGHIQWPEAVKTALKATWRYTTFNGGEDWAVALPYVYFMKAQRSAINHYSPGFAYDSDLKLNGGGLRADGQKIIGNYNRAGAFDFHTRFTFYNMGTVAYRELYTFLGEKFKGHKTALYGAPDKEPPKNIVEKTGNAFKWMTRSVIKAGIYMTPAVPFFWITRSTQYKYRGAVIDPNKGVLVGNYDRIPSPIKMDDISTKGKPHHYAKYDNSVEAFHHDSELIGHPLNADGGLFKTYRDEKGPLNAVGKVNNRGREALESRVSKLGAHFDTPAARSFSSLYFNSVTSYTPYMYAKAEAANLWDDGKMDMSIERAIDGAVKLNFGEFKAGLNEIGHSILHKPLIDPAREKEAQRRIDLDESAADDFIETKGEMKKIDTFKKKLKDSPQKPNWRERIVAAPKEDKLEVGANSPKNYAEKEEMRKALEELQPPTNSIN